jgi:Icc-related predicted phosphoesterase
VLKQVTRFFPAESEASAGEGAEEGTGDLTKILVLPSLPTAEPFRTQSVEVLKERGVDAIISFRAMLLDIIEKIETNRNYGKSDTLQVMRILKNYDLLKDTQMEMFPERAPVSRKSSRGQG